MSYKIFKKTLCYKKKTSLDFNKSILLIDLKVFITLKGCYEFIKFKNI